MKILLPAAVLMTAAFSSHAKTAVVSRLATPPVPVEAGLEFSVCAANVGTVKADIQLQFVSVRTGAVVATRDVTLPPPGTGAMPDPCLTTTADAVLRAGNATAADGAMVVAIVAIRRGLFNRPPAATAGLQVMAAGPAGARHVVASVPLEMVTNPRNGMVETVH
jgi:hypothetical protein